MDRWERKQVVFPILYGGYRDATPEEMHRWRGLCAQFIKGEIDDVPLTLEQFRGWAADNARVVHGFDPGTRKPYTYLIPDPKENTEVPNVDPLILTIAVERKPNSFVAALRNDPDGLVLAIEKPTVTEAVSTLTEMYLKLNPLDVVPGVTPGPGKAFEFRYRPDGNYPWRRKVYTDPDDIKSVLTGAAYDKTPIRLAEVEHVDGSPADPRIFTPHEVKLNNKNGQYLVYGYDSLRGRMGSFRLDCIYKVEEV